MAVDPNLVKDLATRFMASKLLFAANELGVFEALGRGAASLDELSRRTNLPARSVAMLADAMVSLGLVVRDDARYANSPTADALLAGKTPNDMRPLLKMFEVLEYPAWSHLSATLRDGLVPTLRQPLPSEALELFHAGIEVFTKAGARALLASYEFAGRRAVLDVGGGNGSFLELLLAAHPHLQATLFDRPAVLEVAATRFAGSPLRERLQLVGGDLVVDRLPTGHDAIVVANVIHLLAPADTLRLLEHLRTAAEPNTELLLVDLWTNPERTSPALAILMAGEFAIRSEQGDVYSVDTVSSWLERSGWRLVEQRPLGEPLSVLIARPR